MAGIRGCARASGVIAWHVDATQLIGYPAMGIPVVATDMVAVRRFNAEHGEIVSRAGHSANRQSGIRPRTVAASSLTLIVS